MAALPINPFRLSSPLSLRATIPLRSKRADYSAVLFAIGRRLPDELRDLEQHRSFEHFYSIQSNTAPHSPITSGWLSPNRFIISSPCCGRTAASCVSVGSRALRSAQDAYPRSHSPGRVSGVLSVGARSSKEPRQVDAARVRSFDRRFALRAFCGATPIRCGRSFESLNTDRVGGSALHSPITLLKRSDLFFRSTTGSSLCRCRRVSGASVHGDLTSAISSLRLWPPHSTYRLSLTRSSSRAQKQLRHLCHLTSERVTYGVSSGQKLIALQERGVFSSMTLQPPVRRAPRRELRFLNTEPARSISSLWRAEMRGGNTAPRFTERSAERSPPRCF